MFQAQEHISQLHNSATIQQEKTLSLFYDFRPYFQAGIHLTKHSTRNLFLWLLRPHLLGTVLSEALVCLGDRPWLRVALQSRGITLDIDILGWGHPHVHFQPHFRFHFGGSAAVGGAGGRRNFVGGCSVDAGVGDPAVIPRLTFGICD